MRVGWGESQQRLRGLDGLSRGRVEEEDRGEHLRPAVGPVGVLHGVGQRGRLFVEWNILSPPAAGYVMLEKAQAR